MGFHDHNLTPEFFDVLQYFLAPEYQHLGYMEPAYMIEHFAQVLFTRDAELGSTTHNPALAQIVAARDQILWLQKKLIFAKADLQISEELLDLLVKYIDLLDQPAISCAIPVACLGLMWYYDQEWSYAKPPPLRPFKALTGPEYQQAWETKSYVEEQIAARYALIMLLFKYLGILGAQNQFQTSAVRASLNRYFKLLLRHLSWVVYHGDDHDQAPPFVGRTSARVLLELVGCTLNAMFMNQLQGQSTKYQVLAQLAWGQWLHIQNLEAIELSAPRPFHQLGWLGGLLQEAYRLRPLHRGHALGNAALHCLHQRTSVANFYALVQEAYQVTHPTLLGGWNVLRRWYPSACLLSARDQAVLQKLHQQAHLSQKMDPVDLGQYLGPPDQCQMLVKWLQTNQAKLRHWLTQHEWVETGG